MTDVVPEIDIASELLPRHLAALDTVAQLGVRYGAGRWVLVGGMMVLILGREHETRAPRAEGTKDADILLDIVAAPSLLHDVTHFLDSIGYRLLDGPGDETKAARCSFAFHSAQIDVLCPDDTPQDQLAVPGRNVESIAIPGGRRALETARAVSLYYSADRPNAEVFLPTLAGGIAAKVASATDPRTANSPRHLQDVGFLLTIEADPAQTRTQLSRADLGLLREIESHVLDTRSPMWAQLDDAQRQVAQATYEYLTA